jgi:hypothetical protein
MDFTVYPRELKASEWKTQKGIVAKLLKKPTGITELLERCERAHDAWLVSCRQYLSQELHLTTQDIRGHELSAFTTLLGKVQQLTKEKASEWEQSRIIPQKAREYVRNISQAAYRFRTMVDVDMSRLQAEGARHGLS